MYIGWCDGVQVHDGNAVRAACCVPRAETPVLQTGNQDAPQAQFTGQGREPISMIVTVSTAVHPTEARSIPKLQVLAQPGPVPDPYLIRHVTGIANCPEFFLSSYSLMPSQMTGSRGGR